MHLAACWLCRTRLREIEDTIAAFIHVHRGTHDPQLPPAAGSRALLRSRLSDAAAKTRRGGGLWARFLHFTLPYRVTAYAG